MSEADPLQILDRSPPLRELLHLPGLGEAVATGKPHQVYEILKKARKKGSPMARTIDRVLEDPRLFAEPMRTTPTLFTLNAVGFRLWGASDQRPDGTYIAGHYLVALFLPILPLGRYVVWPLGKGVDFQGRLPLTPMMRAWRKFAALAASLGAAALTMQLYAGATTTDLHILNALDIPVDVALGEERFHLAPHVRETIQVKIGTVHVTAATGEGKVIEEVDLDLPRWTDLVVYNILGAAPLYAEGIIYGEIQGRTENQVDFLGGRPFATRDNVSYVFRDAPMEINLPQGQAGTVRWVADTSSLDWRTAAIWLAGRLKRPKDALAVVRSVAFAAAADGDTVRDALRIAHQRIGPELERSDVADALLAELLAGNPDSTALQGLREPLVASLLSVEKESREAALDRLRERNRIGILTEAEGTSILLAVPQMIPPVEGEPFPFRVSVLLALAEAPEPAWVPTVETIFSNLDPQAQSNALALLAAMPDDGTSARTFMRLATGAARTVDGGSLRPLQGNPQHADAYFPGLFALAVHEGWRWDVWLTTLRFLDKGVLEPAKIQSQAAPLVTAFRERRSKLMPRQESEGFAWQFTDEYGPLRAYSGLLLDLFGHLPDERVRAELRASLQFRDPRLLEFAALSLLRQGEEAPPAVWEAIAASSETRNYLWDRLEAAGRVELFPAEHRTQAAFAESDLVRWLTFSSELGRPPDQIELMKVFPIESETFGGDVQYYVFRFRVARPDLASEDGWMAGVAGPFRREDAPSTAALGSTFSTFEPWESKSARAHLDQVREMFEE